MAPFIFISQQSYNEELIEISSKQKKKLNLHQLKQIGFILKEIHYLSLSRTYTTKMDD